MVERIRFIGSDAALVDETVEAARASLAAQVPDLVAAVRRHEQDRARLERERANVHDAIARGCGGTMDAKLADLDAQIGAVEQRIAAAEAERAKLAGTTIDEGELRRMLTEFDAIWSEMTPSERARVLAQLIDRITFDGKTGDVEITFRACEP